MLAVTAMREVSGVGVTACHGERWDFMLWMCVEFEDTVKCIAMREGRLSDERVLAANGLNPEQT